MWMFYVVAFYFLIAFISVLYGLRPRNKAARLRRRAASPRLSWVIYASVVVHLVVPLVSVLLRRLGGFETLVFIVTATISVGAVVAPILWGIRYWLDTRAQKHALRPVAG